MEFYTLSKRFFYILILTSFVFSDAPDWDCDGDGVLDNFNDYANSGSITSAVYLDDSYAVTEGDLLAAFVDDVLRGVAIPSEVPFGPNVGLFQFLMLIYSNEGSGETVSFQHYDFDLDLISDIDETIEFESDMVYGDLLDPFIFNISTGVDVVVDFVSGWNWFSLNAYLEDMSLNNVLLTLDDGSATYIKSQSAFADYYSGYGWFGQLTDINNLEMYKLFMTSEESIEFTATPVDVDNTLIPLTQGWNWLGYTPQISVDINIALSNIGDGNASYIKSQAAFADYYSGYGWFGQLSTMNPYAGYQLFMNQSDEFVYSTGDGTNDGDVTNDDRKIDIEDVQAEIQAAVESGEITQEQADEKLAWLEANEDSSWEDVVADSR